MARPLNYFWLDCVRCDAKGIRLQGPVTFGETAPRMNTVSVPGRNGDLHFYDGSFENVQGTASCFILDAKLVPQALAAVQQWCFLETGYHNLETTEEPEVFRQAAVQAGPQTAMRAKILAPFTLKFDCKPQKFFKTGQRVITLTTSGTVLRNPGFTALPLITVYGSGAGTVTAGGTTVQIKTLDGSLTLDCDLQDAYKGTQNKNSTISAPQFPSLPPGDSAITWTGGITRVEVTPRWWTL